MFIVKYRKFFYILSGLLAGLSLAALLLWGLLPGIDFKGGSIIEVEYPAGMRPDIETIKGNLRALDLGDFSVRQTEDTGYIVRTRELTPIEHETVLIELSDNGVRAEEKRFNSIGPVLGREALQKSWTSIILVILGIVLFITFAFRKVSEPVASWKYGLIAIAALIHDVIIPAGIFAALGYFAGVEVDTLFVTALLVILGFSVHNTIVVFDRVRENLNRDKVSHEKRSFERIVGNSIAETLVRSINTSLTTVIAVLALYFLGAEATKNFALALAIGIIAGTYSSIFLAPPLLTTAFSLQKKS